MIDISKNLGTSKSGESTLTATTGGTGRSLDGAKIGINTYGEPLAVTRKCALYSQGLSPMERALVTALISAIVRELRAESTPKEPQTTT